MNPTLNYLRAFYALAQSFSYDILLSTKILTGLETPDVTSQVGPCNVAMYFKNSNVSISIKILPNVFHLFK